MRTRKGVRVGASYFRAGSWMAVGERSREFAVRILARLWVRRLDWPLLRIVFREQKPRFVWNTVIHRNRLHLAPRIALTVVCAPGQSEAQRQWVGQRAASHGKRIEPTAVSPAVVGAIARSVEAEGQLVPGLLQAPLIEPVRQTVRRPGSDPRISEAVRKPVFNPSPSRVPSQFGDGEQIDVNRLTDQVIRAIDHRILAQRERLGRA